MAKERDRDELEDATLREELEVSQEQASQERVERKWLCKVLETAEAEIADLREDLDQARWELEECRRDAELNTSHAKESVCEEMKDRHLKELSMKDEHDFDCWLRKFSHYAELEQWMERQKLLQLELYLSGTLFPEQSNH